VSAGGPARPGSPQWCDDCYGRHTQARRLAVLARCEGMLASEIHAAWAHFWPLTDAGERQLSRDRKALRERRKDAVCFSVDRRI
jgi:hypothetical protein